MGTQLAASAVTAISADPTQRRIMFALPFVFVIFIINFEAGLIVYWITTNVWTIGQQLLVRKLYPKPVIDAERAEEKDGGRARAREATGAAARPRPRRRSATARARRRPTTSGNGGPAKPPPSPRKKKKRSGRRR